MQGENNRTETKPSVALVGKIWVKKAVIYKINPDTYFMFYALRFFDY